jgi:hypothetical protein
MPITKAVAVRRNAWQNARKEQQISAQEISMAEQDKNFTGKADSEIIPTDQDTRGPESCHDPVCETHAARQPRLPTQRERATASPAHSVAPPCQGWRAVTRKRLYSTAARLRSLFRSAWFGSGASAVPGSSPWASRPSSISVRKIRCARGPRVARGLFEGPLLSSGRRDSADPGLRHPPHPTLGSRETTRPGCAFLGWSRTAGRPTPQGQLPGGRRDSAGHFWPRCCLISNGVCFRPSEEATSGWEAATLPSGEK